MYGWMGTVKFAILKTRGHSIVACGITRCTAQVCNISPLKTRIALHAVIEYACIGLATVLAQDFGKVPITIALMKNVPFEVETHDLILKTSPTKLD